MSGSPTGPGTASRWDPVVTGPRGAGCECDACPRLCPGTEDLTEATVLRTGGRGWASGHLGATVSPYLGSRTFREKKVPTGRPRKEAELEKCPPRQYRFLLSWRSGWSPLWRPTPSCGCGGGHFLVWGLCSGSSPSSSPLHFFLFFLLASAVVFLRE